MNNGQIVLNRMVGIAKPVPGSGRDDQPQDHGDRRRIAARVRSA